MKFRSQFALVRMDNANAAENPKLSRQLYSQLKFRDCQHTPVQTARLSASSASPRSESDFALALCG
jgi:hypothetical protein